MDDSTHACPRSATSTSHGTDATNASASSRHPLLVRASAFKTKTHTRLSKIHTRIPYLRALPLPAILIILLLILVNLIVWAICGLILAFHTDTHLLGTAALAYSLGLRHALDADHISAIDLMTRRLIATGQRPVTVGTFFSLGHSTIVVVTSIVVAATAAGVSKHFDGFGTVGGIIGTSVSAVFLILLGVMNAYILYKLVLQMRRVVDMSPHAAAAEGWKIEGGGVLFRVLKRMFKLIDRPWKMYPLGVLFGLGFDTSSEIALLGISSIQGASGTSLWLILIFPVLFTAGMCLVDTADGALMMSMYVAPMGMGGDKKETEARGQALAAEDARTQELGVGYVDADDTSIHHHNDDDNSTPSPPAATPQGRNRVKDPLTFLYYSIVLTTLTVICAIVIGVIQLLSLILNTAHPTGPFWDGVEAAGDNYEIIGGAICASFVVALVTSLLLFGRFKRWVARKRAVTMVQAQGPQEEGDNELGPPYRDEEVAGAAVVRGDAEMGGERRSGEEDGGLVIEEIVEFDGKPVGGGDSSGKSGGKGGVKAVQSELVGGGGGEGSGAR
ncbi:uncharacterized protein HMPREF1541_05602 [Cyphellophora europaea CBS 101466]|uniref:Nickel/cobalt efflux system n=1 Tax=Cyphellophora europaea (strain CBS 101466) TaxID=1220924 RepID=W2RUL3_CYPE1|nr:uncharacterized protein HMPREF1541_05602 [Cyphellophora europaea CBS 101466]ETN39379.1 hypothetical protein HMPREF1541_05602 [Cyphellophora europaea CBS 101466]